MNTPLYDMGYGMLVVSIALSIYMFFSIRDEYTCAAREKISEAIYRYRKYNKFPANPTVTYWDMEHPNKTFWRLWDWSYTNILPPEKYELVKPYIK